MNPPVTPLFKVFMPESVAAAMTRTLYSGFLAEGAQVVAAGSHLLYPGRAVVAAVAP